MFLFVKLFNPDTQNDFVHIVLWLVLKRKSGVLLCGAQCHLLVKPCTTRNMPQFYMQCRSVAHRMTNRHVIMHFKLFTVTYVERTMSHVRTKT